MKEIILDNNQRKLLCERLCDDLVPHDDQELDIRLTKVEVDLGMLKQMLLIPNSSKINTMHKIYTIKRILEDLVGVKGEPMNGR